MGPDFLRNQGGPQSGGPNNAGTATPATGQRSFLPRLSLTGGLGPVTGNGQQGQQRQQQGQQQQQEGIPDMGILKGLSTMTEAAKKNLTDLAVRFQASAATVGTGSRQVDSQGNPINRSAAKGKVQPLLGGHHLDDDEDDDVRRCFRLVSLFVALLPDDNGHCHFYFFFSG